MAPGLEGRRCRGGLKGSGAVDSGGESSFERSISSTQFELGPTRVSIRR